MTKQTIISDVKKLKVLLIFSTVLYIIYFAALLFSNRVFKLLELNFYLTSIAAVIFVLFKAYFIWFIWKKYPATKQGRIVDSLMIFFIGIIGMWLWIPNKKEIEGIINTKSYS